MQMTNIKPKKFDEPRPYPVVMGIVHDGERLLVIHRSKTVRSAPDAWSVPTGLHEWGETLSDQLQTELMEEFNLTLLKAPIAPAYTYESISPNGDGWHWVIMVFLAKVETFGAIVNNEPDKHDQFKLLTFREFNDMVFDDGVTWTPNLKRALIRLLPKIEAHMERKY
jgi:ADP-ribose pyrophosphatase YjhB (NUDIX family)